MAVRRWFWLTALAVVALAGGPGAGSAQQSFRYTARLADPLLAPGEFKAPKLVWSCKGNVCTTRSPVAAPTVGQCRELAKLVGRVTAFGNENRSLGSAGLEACAKGIALANTPGPSLVLPNLPGLGDLSNLTRNIGKGGSGKGPGKEDGKSPGEDASPEDEPPPLEPYPGNAPRVQSDDEGTTIRTSGLVLEGSAEPSGAPPPEPFISVVIRTGPLVLEARSSVIRTPTLVLESTGP